MPKLLADHISDTLNEAKRSFSQEEKTTEALLWLKRIEENSIVLPPLVREFLIRILTAENISEEDRKFIQEHKSVLRDVLDYLKNVTKSSFGGTTVGTVRSHAPYGHTSRGQKSGKGKPQR